MKNAHVVAIAVGVGFGSMFIGGDTCRDAWFKYGITIGQCPDGTVRQTGQLDASQLRRGAKGYVTFTANAHYTTSAADDVQTAAIEHVQSIDLTLLDTKNTATQLPVKEWVEGWNGARTAEV